MESWIQAIRNAIESAIDGSGTSLDLLGAKSPPQNFKRHPIGDMFSKGGKDRRTVSGSQETRELLTGGNERAVTAAKTPSILSTIRGIDPSNSTCADCGSTTKTEWCSINLAVILCIGTSRQASGLMKRMQWNPPKFRIPYF
jgi:Arf-GAP/SH3 domain/ANK repeat/PH domain-containing protein